MLVLNLLGRISAINTLAVCYVYSAEVFPTIVRTAGLGSSSFWARVGPMVSHYMISSNLFASSDFITRQIAPFIADLSVYGDTVPLAVFGGIALVAAFLVTFMPETSDARLPDTIEDGEAGGAGDSLWTATRARTNRAQNN